MERQQTSSDTDQVSTTYQSFVVCPPNWAGEGDGWAQN